MAGYLNVGRMNIQRSAVFVPPGDLSWKRPGEMVQITANIQISKTTALRANYSRYECLRSRPVPSYVKECNQNRDSPCKFLPNGGTLSPSFLSLSAPETWEFNAALNTLCLLKYLCRLVKFDISPEGTSELLINN